MGLRETDQEHALKDKQFIVADDDTQGDDVVVVYPGMGIFAVALPQFRQRYDYIVAHMQSHFGSNFEVFGVMGKDCSASVLAEGIRLSPGQIGCAMSHLAIYRRMIEQDLECALIVEDDVVLPADIHRILHALAPVLKRGEVIQLNNWKDGDCLLSRVSMSEIAGLSLYHPLNATSLGSACAYLIDRQAVERILQINFPLRVTADNWEYFCQKDCLSTARVAFPSPVMLKAFESTITHSNRARTNFRGLLVDTLRRLVFNSLRSLRRRWILRNRSREVRFTNEPSCFS